MRSAFFRTLFASTALATANAAAAPQFESELIFPLESWHNHGSCIVEAPNGELVVCWFHGSGERQADDVRILGAKKSPETGEWTEPFPMADVPEFPDTNCCMIIDPEDRLWLFWPTIQANLWESALMKYKISVDYQRPGAAPEWKIQKTLHIKPGADFPEITRNKTAAYLSHRELSPGAIEWAANNFKQADDKLTRRIGWFTRAHPFVSDSGRLLVGLYSDGFSFSLVALTDNWGESWSFSDPIIGGGAIQPSFAQRKDGTILTFMRDNGPAPKRVHYSESTDDGETWSLVKDHPQLRNPGAGLELMELRDGRFVAIYNDTEEGRHQLAIAISEDEGRTFNAPKYIEKSAKGTGSYHYPSLIEAKDGTLHATYSYFLRNEDGSEGKSIKHAAFNLDWLEAK